MSDRLKIALLYAVVSVGIGVIGFALTVLKVAFYVWVAKWFL